MRRGGPVFAAAIVALALPSVTAARAASACTSTAWREVGRNEFVAPLGAIRSQGATSNGTGWWFSWQGGLSRSDNHYRPTVVNPIAIPPDLIAAGSDHIGDIDLYRNRAGALRVIAPIEDGGLLPTGKPEYQHPWLVFYDATTLQPTGRRYELPQALHTAGVPWVAVDQAHQQAITAEWDDTTLLNVWAIEDGMRLVKQIPLSRTLGRIQGAKVWKGWLYAARDDDQKSIVRINLATGAVEDLYQLGETGEQEGIAVTRTADGALLHVLFVHGSVDDPTHFGVAIHHIAPPCGSHL
jgi:hypothetical protein